MYKGMFGRSPTAGAAVDCPPDPADGYNREGPLRRGVAGALARGERGRQDILLARGVLLVQRGRDLPDGDAATREYTRVHCGR
jgi:hypothetical protein